MKVKEIKRIKNNKYEIILDNDKSYHLYDDIIIKYHLLINKELTISLFNQILKENDSLESYYMALKYISRKMRSILEIEKYLQKQNFSKKIINLTIEKLKKEKYLDDIKFSQSYINDQFNLSNNGPEKIKYNLIKLGVKEQDINIDKNFDQKITHLINKKHKSNHKLSTNALKINIINYMINLGYPKEMFIDKLETISAPDKNLIKKDYNKLIIKYKNKYDSNKLKIVIKNKLYQKGYTLENINSIIGEEI